MKQILDGWFADHFSWGPVQSCRSWASRIATALLAALILHPLACAETAPPAQLTQASRHKAAPHKPAPPVIAEATPAPAPPPEPPPVPPPPRTPAEMPPVAPEVVWDGKQLSIHAENSTLSSILAAVQAQTGASIDIPSGAAAERVVVQLGPAPIRDVLTSLLYGTSYDYIIQASDTNKDSISSVIITAHSKGDDVVASAGPAGSSSGPGVHRMPGYSASGKPNFVAQYEAQADQSGGAEPAAEPVTPSPESGSASASSASAAQSPAGKEDAQRAASSSSSDSNSPAGNDVPPASASASPSSASAASDASGNPPSGMDQMVQDLQHLYQQRRQIQAQQNQTQQNQNQPPPAN